MKRPCLFAVALLSLGVLAVAQRSVDAQPASHDHFDVVSIKPNTLPTSVSPARFTVRSGGLLVVTNNPLSEIIQTAYEIREYQLVGGPQDILNSSFNVEARGEGMPQLRFPPALDTPGHPVYPMLRTMLEERCKLVVHHETRPFPVYALELARKDGTLGPKLSRSTRDCAPINAARGSDKEDHSFTETGAPPCGLIGSVSPALRLAGDSLSMPFILYALAGYAGRPIVDHTGITGSLNFVLEFTPDGMQVDPARNVPSLFTAVEEQLGLKLVTTTAPLDVLVIDHLERPTED